MKNLSDLKKLKPKKEKGPQLLVVPDFMLIGAPEAGGRFLKNWLQKYHSKIWFAPLDNIAAFHPAFPIQRMELVHKLLRKEIPLNPTLISWLIKYFSCYRPSPKWYSKLFPKNADQYMLGEFSEEYMTLPFQETRELNELMPDCKIIIMLRHPADRAFAALKKTFGKNSKVPFKNLSKKQVIALLSNDLSRRYSGYQMMLDHWGAFYPPENIFIGFYEDLISEPNRMFTQLQEFLGLEKIVDLKPEDVLRFQKAGTGACPAVLLPHLHEFYREEVVALAKRVGSHAEKWAADYPPPPPRPEPEPEPEEDADEDADTSSEETAKG